MVAVAGILILEFQVLSGEHVMRESGLRFSDSVTQTVTFDVPEARLGQRHSVIVHTGDDEVALAWRVVDPYEWELHSDRELIRSDRNRRFDFIAEDPGEYTVVVERLRRSRRGVAIGTGDDGVEIDRAPDFDSVSVRLMVNDRRVLGPLVDRCSRYLP